MSGFISGQSSKTTVPRTVRVFTASEKLAAIQRVRAGATKASVARDMGVPESTLRGWCKKEDKIRYQVSLSSPDSDNSRCKRFKLDDSNTTTSPVSSRPQPRANPQKRASTSPNVSPELNRSCSGLTPTADETSALTESILAHWRNCQYQLMQQLPSYESSVNESVLGWLRSQEAGADKNSPPPPVVSNAGALHTNAIPSTSATCPPSFSYASGLCMNPSPWLFASLYNQLVNHHRQNQTQDTSNSESEQRSPEPQRQEESSPSQQLTENTQAPESPPEQEEAENPSTKTREMLNHLLLDNMDSDDENDENINGMDHTQAMRHAEKFMNWLTTDGTLYVTPSQLVSCETVVNNVSKDIESRMSNQLKYRRR